MSAIQIGKGYWRVKRIRETASLHRKKRGTRPHENTAINKSMDIGSTQGVVVAKGLACPTDLLGTAVTYQQLLSNLRLAGVPR